MKKKQIKQKINNAFNEETPDFLAKIKSECESVNQVEPVFFQERKAISFGIVFKKMIYVTMAFILFIVGFTLGNFEMNHIIKQASIYLDVNPSIEIQVDDENVVIDTIAGNDDGEKILSDISLKGVQIDTALYAIVGAMYTNGYLNSQTNSILVSVESDNDELVILDDICYQIDNIFKENEEMTCSIIAQKVNSDVDLKNKANQYDISVGKMQLIEKIINKCDIYTEDNLEDLVMMSIHELDLVYQSISTTDEKDEIITGKPNGFIKNNDVLDYLINNVEIEQDIIEYECVVLYHKENDNHKMIYLITLELANKEKLKYIIDCSTGDIMPEETVEDWKDRLPNEGDFGKPKDNNHNDPKN